MSNIFWNDQGLIAAVAQDVQAKEILVMAWVNTEALIEILTTQKVCYWSVPDKPYGEIDQPVVIYGEVIIHSKVLIAHYAVIYADEIDAQGEMKNNL
ncbi:hypothetical protein [Psychrobacter sp. AOP7-A1-24]|uniref:hypothetical protein n=1 Tax=Psychrobacter sp. AOP7-A1-24 TaxID=3457646 RepID=UPI00402BC373